MDGDFAVVLVTAPDLDSARRLTGEILKTRSAACVNLLSAIESHYWWEGAIQTGNEVLLLIKTTSEKLAELEKVVLANHPYDTPEFIVLPIIQGAERYLAWVADSVQPKR